MAVTQADIDALNQAIADGVRQVSIQGQTTVFNTTDSLIAARNSLQAELNRQETRAAGKRPSQRTMLFYGGRGY